MLLKFLICTLATCLVLHFMLNLGFRVEGFAVFSAKPGPPELFPSLSNSLIVFKSKECGAEYECKTDKEGDFFIRLPCGSYKVYRREGGRMIRSPSVIVCESDIKCRVMFTE